MLRKSLISLSALAMVATPVVAQAAERAPSPVAEDEGMVGTGLLLPIAAVIAVLVGVLVLDDDDSEPVSP